MDGSSGKEQLQKVTELAAALRQLNSQAIQARDAADAALGATTEEHSTLQSFVQAVIAAEVQIKSCNDSSRKMFPLVRDAMQWCREFPKQTQAWAQPDGSPGPCETLRVVTATHELLLIDELAPRFDMLRGLPQVDSWKNRWHWWRMQRDGGEVSMPEVPSEPEVLFQK
eukprot:GGOE01061057.1.p1 GENE.GGOE01061057.1~~GGOE01061057.1.p1  ORF type:complete len:181 (+),score=37.54 GGOE01061057.1:39-545(+)